MRKHNSLKHRLLALALTTMTAVWLGAIAFTYFDARKEVDEILDAHLSQSATLLVVHASHELAEIRDGHTSSMHKYSRHVVFQIWEDGKVLKLHSPNTPEQPLADIEEGFSDKVINGQHWRVFSTWDDSGNNLIHVAESTQEREDIARTITLNLLKPMLFSLPLLALLLWLAISRGLRPLVGLTAEVAQREPDNLAPLAMENAPREVQPLIGRLNELFTRVAASLQKERRFTADAAHELRTPIAGIKAQVQVASTASAAPERNHALDNALIGCDLAAHLIEQLLTLSRIDTLGLDTAEPCRLRAIAAETIAAIAPAALERDVRIELADGEEREVRGNPALLGIMLRNLIDNAVRHTLPGTLVKIAVAHTQNQTRLSVTDNGPGIPEPELARVLERFYRPAGTSASGSGLGLSIVQRIAEIHSARLQLERAPQDNEKGLCATVIFPS